MELKVLPDLDEGELVINVYIVAMETMVSWIYS